MNENHTYEFIKQIKLYDVLEEASFMPNTWTCSINAAVGITAIVYFIFALEYSCLCYLIILHIIIIIIIF